MMKCEHKYLELLEEDEDCVWMRCAKCFVLFRLSKEEFKKLKPIDKGEKDDEKKYFAENGVK